MKWKIGNTTELNGRIGIQKSEQTVSDLRTTCPNVLRKFEQVSTIRNTTNFTSKMGAIMADVRKYEEEEQRNMKKNGINPNTETPTVRLE
jgi:hypothetical protein